MSSLSEEERKNLLALARFVIESKLDRNVSNKRPAVISESLKVKRGCFVTLHQKGTLRGCIGTIEPVTPLIDCVEENAFNAAFRDPRFPSLKKNELPGVEIEISVLTVPVVLDFKDAEDLKRKLKPGRHGVILSRGFRKSTFLPQVWEQLPGKETFLGHLCQKGGMDRRAWMNTETVVKIYEAEYFSEPD